MKQSASSYLTSVLKEVVPERGLPKPAHLSRLDWQLELDGTSIRKKRAAVKMFRQMTLSCRNKKADECWEWELYRSEDGYGMLRFSDITIAAHRLSYIMHYRVDPGELLVCHHCDNPPCFNPAHLFLGDLDANNKDRARKGRSVTPHGEDHYFHVLKECQVKEIVDQNPVWSYGLITKLAKQYKVSRSAIQGVLYGRSWKWITRANGRTPFTTPLSWVKNK